MNPETRTLAARDDRGRGRGRPHLHDPDGRAGRAAAAVHRENALAVRNRRMLMSRAQGPGAATALLSLLFLPASLPHAVGWFPDHRGGRHRHRGPGGKGGNAWPRSRSRRRAIFGPFEGRIALACIFSDDLGESLGRLYRSDQGRTSGRPPGVHRKANGFGWRAEAHRAIGDPAAVLCSGSAPDLIPHRERIYWETPYPCAPTHPASGVGISGISIIIT
mgnify:CR=1 FL=1